MSAFQIHVLFDIKLFDFILPTPIWYKFLCFFLFNRFKVFSVYTSLAKWPHIASFDEQKEFLYV